MNDQLRKAAGDMHGALPHRWETYEDGEHVGLEKCDGEHIERVFVYHEDGEVVPDTFYAAVFYYVSREKGRGYGHVVRFRVGADGTGETPWEAAKDAQRRAHQEAARKLRERGLKPDERPEDDDQMDMFEGAE